ncbi:MAG: MinD/ParA family protein [Defluviitaleaceae bacterium]|nr:MinD/ParA family protein [Defluviitaleaceae bacterium]MCL2835847.1 MinD/ParA family protein [Defluviitaleaceae bacterium]
MDQAQSLRNIMNKNQPTAGPPQTTSRVITVTSGKGGVGKTNFTVNLGIWLQSQGQRVVIIDADFGLANIEVLFNVWPKFSFADVIRGSKAIPDILTEGPSGIKFISGGTGFKDLANVTERQMAQVLNSFGYLDEISDIILIDTGAGISKTVTTFVKASNEAIVITTPEPTSISDSYTLIKAVCETGEYRPGLGIVLNKVESEKEANAVYERLRSVCEKFLKMTPKNLGSLANDDDLVRAVKEQAPVLVSRPNSQYAKGIGLLGKRILYPDVRIERVPERTGILAFMKRIVSRN